MKFNFSLDWLWTLLVTVLLGWLVVGVGGCASMQPAGFSSEFSDSARQISTAITDQAVFERVLARLDGQIIEPGVEAYAGVLYVAGGKITGASGQLSLEGDGAGSGKLSDEARAVILRLAERPDLVAKWLDMVAAQTPDAEATEAPETDAKEE